MSDYEYVGDPYHVLIEENARGVVRVTRKTSDAGNAYTFHLPDTERVKAAQALAGDEWHVVPKWTERENGRLRRECDDLAKRLFDAEAQAVRADRPPLIDPVNVQVGDVVEVEANDGSWMVRGLVMFDSGGSNKPFALKVPFNHGAIWPATIDATVRLVSRSEPEPDPEQVEALVDLLRTTEFFVSTATERYETACELVRRGVMVGEPR